MGYLHWMLTRKSKLGGTASTLAGAGGVNWRSLLLNENNKVCDFTVAESITHTLCEPHILQGIRGPHDCAGLPFIEDKKPAGQAGNKVKEKPGPLGKGKEVQNMYQ